MAQAGMNETLYRERLQQMQQAPGWLAREPDSEQFLHWCHEAGLLLYQQGDYWRAPPDLALIELPELQKLLGSSIEHCRLFLQCPSTNAYLLAHPSAAPALCLSEHQSAGQGRQGREWQSALGQNLLFSLGVELKSDHATLAVASLQAGIAVAQSLNKLGAPVGLKWPNDLYLNKAKLGGILVQLKWQKERVRVVVGVGLNVHQAPDVHTAKASTSLWQAGYCWQRIDVLQACLAALLEAFQSPESWLNQFAEFDELQGQEVRWQRDDEVLQGVARGIDAEGRLCLHTDQGVQYLNSGEVHSLGSVHAIH